MRGPADRAAPAPPSASAALTWETFTEGLAQTLARLRGEEFLILEVVDGGYVQFAGDPEQLHAEAMSLQYIEGAAALATDARLLAAVRSEMGELGWQLPTELPPELIPEGEPYEGSPNYTMQWTLPIAFKEAARCAVATLRRAYGAATPASLRYIAFANDPYPSPSFPELQIPRIYR